MLDKVKNKYIFEKIFRLMKNKRKLNIIKYNKRIMGRLNINKEHLENYIKLEEFNKKYNTKINDIDIKELNLKNKNIGDEGLKFLIKIEFNGLKNLDLSNNQISDINILDRVNFKELKNLDLSNNQISDINVLEKVNFKKLNKIILSLNKISNINILEKVNFKELKELNLHYNKISDKTILEKVNFK